MERRKRFRAGFAPLFAAIAIALVSSTACNRSSPAASTASPRAVLEQLIAHRRASQYPEMLPLIVPEQSKMVIDTLIAVDGFLAANERLRSVLRDTVGGGLADEADQSAVGASLEIFSRSIEFHEEKIDGDVARIGFVANGQLPLRQARLARTSAGWRYDPGSGGDTRVADAFSQMARALDQTTEELRSGRIRADTLNFNPAPLLDDIRTRLSPGLRQLRQSASGTDR